MRSLNSRDDELKASLKSQRDLSTKCNDKEGQHNANWDIQTLRKPRQVSLTVNAQPPRATSKTTLSYIGFLT